MNPLNRRERVKTMLGLAASAYLPAARLPQDAPVPARGIGRRIRHLSYSDIGGRPDSVQIMMNRRHLYVGHMFSNGVTILDASDPRRLKPVGFFHGGRLHANTPSAGFGRSPAARQRRQYRGDAVL